MDDQEEGQRPSTEVGYHGGPLSEVFGPPESVEQQRATTEVDCHGGPVPEVPGPPEATASLARGGILLQTRYQRRLQPPSGTLSQPTAVILDSVFEKWLQSDNMKLPMFSLSEGPQQSAPTAVALAAAAPAAEAVTGTPAPVSSPLCRRRVRRKRPRRQRARYRRRYLQQRRRPAVLFPSLD